MTVYVDDAFIPATVKGIRGKWCHLMADTRKELDEMAARIGLKPEWIQKSGTVMEHYDVTESMRAKAVDEGAREISWSDSGALVERKLEIRELI